VRLQPGSPGRHPRITAAGLRQRLERWGQGRLHRAQPPRLASEPPQAPSAVEEQELERLGARGTRPDDRAGTMHGSWPRSRSRSTGTTPTLCVPGRRLALHRAGLRSSHNAECRGAPVALRPKIWRKITLKVRRTKLRQGSPTNRWPDVFEEFSRQIARQAGTAHDLVVGDFSTTGVRRTCGESDRADGRDAVLLQLPVRHSLWIPVSCCAGDGRLAADARARRYVRAFGLINGPVRCCPY